MDIERNTSMTMQNYTTRVIVTACALVLTSTCGLAAAQSSKARESTTDNSAANARTSTNDARDAAQQVSEATKVIRLMERDAGMKELLQQAQGVFVVPKYTRAALGVGGRGGEGLLLVKQNGKWSDPAFYNLGGISAGLQAGVETGAIALVLNNQKAVNTFMKENNWSLNADAGLTVANWSRKAQASAGKGDVTAWADTEGLFGDVAVSVTDINFDKDETAAFYGKQVALQDIFSGKARAPSRQVAGLKQALPGGAGATSSGSSGSGSNQSSTGQ
jgi:SH3 domain-containing YSC84-like protein 1